MIDLPSDMDSVVKRWFPPGVDSIASGREADPVGVFVTGTSGSGVSSIEAELDLLPGSLLERAPDVASAAVVLFVFDASAPLGRRALADLASALESTTTGLLVNKIDVHRDWRDVQRLVAASIAELVPRAVDASFWPTSATLAERARIAVDPRMRSTLYEESGIVDVHGFVESALAQHRDVLRERKYNAAVRGAAAGARREILAKARAVTSVSNTAGLRAERARLVDVRDRTRAERSAALRSRMQLARSETIHDINDATRGYAVSAREAIESAGRARLRHLHVELAEQLGMAVSRVDSRLTERLRAVDIELGLSGEPLQSKDLTVDRAEPSVRRRGAEDTMMILVGASAGVGLGRVVMSPLSVVPALDIAVIPASLLLGAVSAWWLVRSRSLVADRAHLRTWVTDVSAAARSSLEQAALARILATETAFSAAAHETSRSVALSADAELERIESELRAAAEHRAAVLAACDRDLATLDRGIERFGGPIRVDYQASER